MGENIINGDDIKNKFPLLIVSGLAAGASIYEIIREGDSNYLSTLVLAAGECYNFRKRWTRSRRYDMKKGVIECDFSFFFFKFGRQSEALALSSHRTLGGGDVDGRR